jgi:hypothetical protein
MNAHTSLGTILLAALAASAPFAASAQENTYLYETVSAWSIRSDADRGYRCYAEAEYFNGAVIRAGFNSEDGSFYMTVGEYSWDWIENGAAYDVEVGFDDGTKGQFRAIGTVVEGDYTYHSLRVQVPDAQEPQFIKQFMDRREMSIARGDETLLTLGLGGTRRATRTLGECQIAMVSAIGEESSPLENVSASLE